MSVVRKVGSSPTLTNSFKLKVKRAIHIAAQIRNQLPEDQYDRDILSKMLDAKYAWDLSDVRFVDAKASEHADFMNGRNS